MNVMNHLESGGQHFSWPGCLQQGDGRSKPSPFHFSFCLTHCLNMEMYERLVVLLLRRCIVGFGHLLSRVSG